MCSEREGTPCAPPYFNVVYMPVPAVRAFFLKKGEREAAAKRRPAVRRAWIFLRRAAGLHASGASAADPLDGAKVFFRLEGSAAGLFAGRPRRGLPCRGQGSRNVGCKKRVMLSHNPLIFLVGMARFERAASASRTLRSSQTEPHPVAKKNLAQRGKNCKPFFHLSIFFICGRFFSLSDEIL